MLVGASATMSQRNVSMSWSIGMLTALAFAGYLPINAIGVLATPVAHEFALSFTTFSAGPSALFWFAAVVSLLLPRLLARTTTGRLMVLSAGARPQPDGSWSGLRRTRFCSWQVSWLWRGARQLRAHGQPGWPERCFLTASGPLPVGVAQTGSQAGCEHRRGSAPGLRGSLRPAGGGCRPWPPRQDAAVVAVAAARMTTEHDKPARRDCLRRGPSWGELDGGTGRGPGRGRSGR
jgi:hypothetical protein